MKPDSPDYIKPLARKLRQEQTPAEALMWERLRHNKLDGHKFYRQYPIGRYIADFYCSSRKLIIELDGVVHDTERSKEYDRIRDITLKATGMRVIRFRNEQVASDMEAVLAEIRYQLSL